MHSARIAELLRPFLAGPTASASSLEPCHSEPANAGEKFAVLSSAQLQDISTYINLLIRWNARVNLTAIRDPEEIVTRHFGESLFAAQHLFPARVGTAAPGCPAERSSAADRPTVADLGSGAGFPGLPIKLWAPEIALTLIESNHKKATFLREVARALTLTDVNIQAVRAETLTAAAFDLVTLRAVERFAAILPVAANLVAPGGRLALLISAAQLDQARTSLPHFSWTTPEPIPLSDSRVLVVAHRPRGTAP